ncbi:MAG: NUDIX hydrolase [Pseudomonadales bacterium]
MPERTRTGVICLHKDQLLTIELQDPMTRKRFWSVPGGAVEPGETIAEAAVRETLEETGYRVELTSDGHATRYDFSWNATCYDCTTWWYSARLLSGEPAPVDDADYLLQARWLDWPKCQGLFVNRPAFAGVFSHFLLPD